MGPGTIVDRPAPPEQTGDVVDYNFEFDRWHCGWDALRILEYEGIRFPANQHFAWCGPRLGLTPSNRFQETDTILELPRRAERVVLLGHTGNSHYGFPGAEHPIEAIDRHGRVVASGRLDTWQTRRTSGLVLTARNITSIRIATSKPVVFLTGMRVYFGLGDGSKK